MLLRRCLLPCLSWCFFFAGAFLSSFFARASSAATDALGAALPVSSAAAFEASLHWRFLPWLRLPGHGQLSSPPRSFAAERLYHLSGTTLRFGTSSPRHGLLSAHALPSAAALRLGAAAGGSCRRHFGQRQAAAPWAAALATAGAFLAAARPRRTGAGGGGGGGGSKGARNFMISLSVRSLPSSSSRNASWQICAILRQLRRNAQLGHLRKRNLSLELGATCQGNS